MKNSYLFFVMVLIFFSFFKNGMCLEKETKQDSTSFGICPAFALRYNYHLKCDFSSGIIIGQRKYKDFYGCDYKTSQGLLIQFIPSIGGTKLSLGYGQKKYCNDSYGSHDNYYIKYSILRTHKNPVDLKSYNNYHGIDIEFDTHGWMWTFDIILGMYFNMGENPIKQKRIIMFGIGVGV